MTATDKDGGKSGVASILVEVAAVSAGGPYKLREGGSVLLQGGAFFAQGGDSVEYAWDIAGFENYGDLAGASPTLTWEQALLLGIADGDGSSRTIRMRATNSLGESVFAEAQLELVNAAPTAYLVGSIDLKVGVEATFVLQASDPSFVDWSRSFSFSIDWDGDGTDDETIAGPVGTTVRHTYARGGEYAVRVTATDADGDVGEATVYPVVVSGWKVEADGENPGLSNLVYWGTRYGDAFILLGRQGDSIGFIHWSSAGQLSLEIVTGVTGKVVAYGHSGVDYLVVGGELLNAVSLHGGEGDDVLIGGLGGGLLDGGDGDDVLLAQVAATSGLAVAGAPFTLLGGAGQDLLVAGQVQFAGGLPDAARIQAEWTSDAPVGERIAHLTGEPGGLNDGFLLSPADTILSNNAVDTVLGGDAEDWLLYDFGIDLAPDAAPVDHETDLSP